ncbi:hypothetical protein [Flavivirga spongiicola]|uniref:Lipoprotein n=1 Tax=Flavivirga spongiicola TaxID=421621 RepID=A0ABU7XY22_9FLAO|nr:hypothetical protein [Flavivirga sp. MEBiC05379]MDO5979759.1 hypothetical protein [Flavivirga sp. MEBiC05379]
MKKAFLSVTLLLLTILSCNNDDDFRNTCNVINPIEDLSWLKAKIAEFEKENSDFLKFLYFSQTKYNEQTVYVLGDCCPNCNTVFLVYNCAGTNIGTLGNGDGYITSDILNSGTIIWKSENSECF